MNYPLHKPISLLFSLFLIGCGGSLPPPEPMGNPPGQWMPGPPAPPEPSEPGYGSGPSYSSHPPNPCTDTLNAPSPPSASDSPWSVARTASNKWEEAGRFDEDFWSNGKDPSGLAALQLYHDYRGLVSPSDSLVPYALLRSIAIYCQLGCAAKAESLAQELKESGEFGKLQNDLSKALSYCRGYP